MSEAPQQQRSPDASDMARLTKSLRRIARARTRLVVCFWTLPVYVVAIWMLLNNGRNIDSMMWIYMGVYALFAIDMSMRNCPVCRKQFYVKNIFMNLLTRRCVHCGQSSAPEYAAKD